jgi:3-deoxy-D-manno-octulosonate cytidylyltransferase
MKKIAMIPARYAATRFPAKLMQMLGDKTVIRRTYENTVATGLFDEVLVVTDSELIFHEITSYGGRAVMSLKTHDSGSDRIAEAVAGLDFEIVVNVQGDEPFMQREPLRLLLEAFAGDAGEKVKVASMMKVSKDPERIANPNCVKVAVDKHNNSLLFSRSLIPYHRDQAIAPVYYEHIGVYAYRRQTLLDFTQWPMTPLESVEKLEQLRYLENGVPLKMVVVDFEGVGIDTPEDLERAVAILMVKE